jgi:outer membrane protein assembly factor BamB
MYFPEKNYLEKEKMKTSKNKTLAILIALILLTSMAFSLTSLPTASAHSPPWQITTYAYVNAVPERIGVGQPVFIVMWTYLKMPASTIANPIRMQDYMLNITHPDGTVETIGPYTPDPTETTYTTYTPTQVGDYTIIMYHPDTVYVWDNSVASGASTWTNDTFLGGVSDPKTFTVQQEPIPSAPGSYPLPTSYWNYPIEVQNTYWYTVASNWLGSGSPQIGSNLFQQDGSAPNSAHVMWTKPLQAGGIVGGTNVGNIGNQFYTGQAYNARFPNPIILEGKLYYREPSGESGQAGDTVCLNIRTGQEVWRRSDLPTLSFAMTYDLETPNQEGVLYNGILFSSNFGRAFDPLTGNPMFNVTGVPSGVQVLGPDGSILRYVFKNYGNNANPNWYLMEWNSSNLWNNAGLSPTIGPVVDGSAANMFDWNVSVPWYPKTTTTGSTNGVTSQTIVALNANTGFKTATGESAGPNILMGINGTTSQFDPGYQIWAGANNGTANPYTIWAVSTDPATAGQLLWMKTYTAPSGSEDTGILVWPETIDFTTGVFNVYEQQTMNLYGFSITNGDQVWGPQKDTNSFDTFTGSVNTENTGSHRIAYGNLYYSGYGGVLFCYNETTGNLQWTYGNGGEGNSTVPLLGTPWGHFPIFIAAIADGKVFLFSNEHSPTTPLYKGVQTRAVNATTGQEIWTLLSWDDGGNFVANGGAVAAGEWLYVNVYDEQIYAIGQGPSALTVEAPLADITLGSGLVIRGTVMDTSAGTQQEQQKANFPNGVPVVSDASQGDWMPYVYMQKPKPTNTTGVPVSIDVIDANGNYRSIGTATTDSSGAFSLQWTPDIPGKYTVIATFAGSESYWPSSSETSFAVDAAAPTLAPTAAPAQSAADLYFVPAVIGIIVAIIIVGAVLAMIMLRKRP